MPLKSNPNPFPLIPDDEQDAVLTGRRIGAAMLSAVYGPPLSERQAPEPLQFSRTLNGTGGIRPPRLSPAQRRLLDVIRAYGGAGEGAEYWPAVNDWVKDGGRAKALALHNINATVAALLKAGVVTIDDDGLFHITPEVQS